MIARSHSLKFEYSAIIRQDVLSLFNFLPIPTPLLSCLCPFLFSFHFSSCLPFFPPRKTINTLLNYIVSGK